MSKVTHKKSLEQRLKENLKGGIRVPLKKEADETIQEVVTLRGVTYYYHVTDADALMISSRREGIENSIAWEKSKQRLSWGSSQYRKG